MSEGIMIMMIAVSTLLGAIGLIGLVWAVRQGHFDDYKRLIDAVRNDSVEDLRDAAMLEEKKRKITQAKKAKRDHAKGYRPPD